MSVLSDAPVRPGVAPREKTDAGWETGIVRTIAAVGLLMTTFGGCATAPAHTSTTRTGSGNPVRLSCGADCTGAKPLATSAPAGITNVGAQFQLRWPVWIGVVCDDLQAQRRFYRDVLGMRESDVGDGSIWFDLDGKLFELLARSKLPQYAQRGVTVGFLVDDIQAARATLIQRGVEPIGPIESVPTSSWAYFKDSEGALFEIVQKHGANPAPAGHADAEARGKP
jgi:predicted enzyme related to lactoylglutathione lyase